MKYSFCFFNYCFVIRVIVNLIIRIFVVLVRYGILVFWEVDVGDCRELEVSLDIE